jgi:hypothetical protein
MPGEFRYIPPDEVAERHRARSPAAPPRQKSSPPAPRKPATRNVEQVLSLGSDRFVTFGAGTYRIPPVPYKLGHRVLDQQVKVLAHAKQVALTGQKKPMDEFYRASDELAKLLWKHVRPLGKARRLLWRVGLMPNPFRSASEAELKEITDFFLMCRMTSSVRSTSEREARV